MPDLASEIARLPRLDRTAPFSSLRQCKVCAGEAINFDRVDFNKYCDVSDFHKFGLSGVLIDYYRCLFCGYIFTHDFDAWTQDDFAKLIYNADYIQVDGEYAHIRPKQLAKDYARRLRGCEKANILDYGSGAGVFVDLLRAHGFQNVSAYDPFSSPRRPTTKFDIITCFEVIEHTQNPLQTIADMKSYLRDDGCVIISQTVQPPDILAIRGNWWYVAPRNGHVSTYSEEALYEIARRHDLTLHKGANIYGFAQPNPSSVALRALYETGPSLSVLRIFAPLECAASPIVSPEQAEIIWHPTRSDGIWCYRWSGCAQLKWHARWSPVDVLQVRVPLHREVTAGCADHCSLELACQRKPAMRDRGELVAEFDVRGLTSGDIFLRTPDPMSLSADHTQNDEESLENGPVGLGILVSQQPCADHRNTKHIKGHGA